MKKVLITTGISFNDSNLIKKEIESLGEDYEFYRIGVKYNEHLFEGMNVKLDDAPNIGLVDPRMYDQILIFKDFGFEDVNSGIANLEKRTEPGRVRVIDGWDRENPHLFQNKTTTPGMSIFDMLTYWSDVQPMDGTYLEKSMSSTLTSKPYMEKVLGNMGIDLKGDLPTMRVEMAKHSIKLFYVFRYIFPNIFSRIVWYGFMCHNGMVYCIYCSVPNDPAKNYLEITRVAFYPGTNPTTADMFSATLRTMNPNKPNLPVKSRLYDIKKYKSLEEYVRDPDNAYLLSQDKFVGLNLQSGNMFLASLDIDRKIKMEGI